MRRVVGIGLLCLLLCACNLTTQPATPTPTGPTVTFLFPANNVSVVEETDLQIQLLAQDNAPEGESNVGIARVELNVDGSLHQQATPVEAAAVPVFTVDMNWLAQGVGLHALEATAYRLDGTASTPVLINVKVTASGTANSTPEITPSSPDG